ncbi:MAG: aminopeptidase [Candidatus Aenigmarchaeota archaeon]|nr:aminopeptidase [Candidatus Aenigmarchaeota archaeon]
MISERGLKKIARLTVKGMRIGRKKSKGIELAKKKFGEKFISKILEKKWISPKEFNTKERRILEKLEDPKFGPLLVKVRGKYFVKKFVGETVRVVYSEVEPEIRKLVEFMKEEIWKRGAHVIDLTYSSKEARKRLKLIPFDTAAELTPTSKALAKTVDVGIFIGGEEDIYWIRGLEWKAKLGSKSSQKLREIIDRRKVRWLYFGWPVKKNEYFVDEKTYRNVFYETIKKSFHKRTLELCKFYEEKLRGANKIRIVADDGTDLTFRIKGRPILLSDGKIDDEDLERGDVGLNIPDGEVYVAPLEHSANGYIKFDWVPIHGFGLVRDLEIKFKRGKVVWFNSPQKRTFKKFLEANTGEKDRIAELGIGTNPSAKPIGETIVDEKIFGSIHIAIGNNRGSFHGKNKASSHLDMIKIMKGVNGKIYVDGKLIMDDGLPVKE